MLSFQLIRWNLSVQSSAMRGAQRQGSTNGAWNIARFVVWIATRVFLLGLPETSWNALVTQTNSTPREAPNALELISLLHMLKSPALEFTI